MTSALRATAALSAGTLGRILVGLVSVKAWALLVGPAGLGTFGLLQGLVGIAVVVASTGVGTGVVRLGAGARGEGDAGRASDLGHAAVALAWVLGLISAGVLIVLQRPLARLMLGDAAAGQSVVVMSVAVLFSVVTVVETGVLNAYHRVGSLAQLNAAGALAGAVATVAVLVWQRERGIAWSVAAGAVATWAVTRWYAHREARAGNATGARPALRLLVRRAGEILRLGVPLTGSALVGAGVMSLLPAVVVHLLDTPSVGLYRAALGVSTGYIGFLLAAMAVDYYPRLAAAPAGDVERVVNEQLRLILTIGGPVILIAQATAATAIPLLYTSEFTGAVPVLEWQLVGMLFRFWSYGFAFVVLARLSSAAYFTVELIWGMATLGFTYLGVRVLGLVGAGVGFLAAYVVYAVVVWYVVHTRSQIRIDRSVGALMSVLVVLSVGSQVLTLVAPPPWASGAAAAAALAVSAWSARSLWGAARGGRGLNAGPAVIADASSHSVSQP